MSPSPEFVTGKSREWQQMTEGVKRQILAHGPDLMVVRVEFTKGAVGALHHHPHRQATYVARGKFEATVGGQKATLSEGDTFFAAADVPHSVVALEDGTLIDTFTPAREDFLTPRG